jgi:tetratricopeptide (TPR) repeat protein
MHLDSIPEKIRFDAATAVFLRGSRCFDVAIAPCENPLPEGWQLSPADVTLMMNPSKLRSAIDYFDIAISIYSDITAMNLRAIALKMLGEWEQAMVAFETVAALASNTSNKAYFSTAEAELRSCRAEIEKIGADARARSQTQRSASSELIEPLIDPPYASIALSFAEALMQGNYHKAHGLLSPALQGASPESDLRRSYGTLIEYGDGPVEAVDIGVTMEDWPDKQAGDVGWVYVHMTGEGFGEAVTVIVAEESKGLAIRAIEWGRP